MDENIKAKNGKPDLAVRSCRLLLIEDDADLATVMAESLSDLAVQITSCETVEAGLRSVQETCPDILILDLGLPDGDGEEVVWQLRNGDFAELSLIVYTVHDLSREDKVRLKLGCTHYLTKSQASLEQLRTIVAKMISDGIQP